jgi:hypothetical protein
VVRAGQHRRARSALRRVRARHDAPHRPRRPAQHRPDPPDGRLRPAHRREGLLGRGYGTETTRLVLGYGFAGLNLHSIRLSVYGHNPRALRAYERAGFRVIGRWRESYRLGGEALDTIFMDCLATEFTPPMPERC